MALEDGPARELIAHGLDQTLFVEAGAGSGNRTTASRCGSPLTVFGDQLERSSGRPASRSIKMPGAKW